MLIVVNGVLNPRLDDPRLSQSQVAACRRIAEADPRATVEGLDAKMRPVVGAKLGAGRRTKTALMRNGDPATVARPLAERWT